MSDPNSSRDNSSGTSVAGKFVVVVVVAAVVAYVVYVVPRRDDDDGKRRSGSNEVENRLNLTRTALAATENMETVAADQSWSLLFGKSAEDDSVALNRSLNRVLRVDELSKQAVNASLDAAERKEARVQLPDAISGARQSIEDYGKVATDKVIPLWLAARVDLHEASLLPGSMTKSLRKKVYKRLAEAITGEPGKSSRGRILGGVLIQVVEQLEDPIDGLPPELLDNAVSTVATLSDQHSDNLFFALRASRLSIAVEDKQAAKYVARASELSRAIEPSLRRETQPIGVTPDELVAEIIAAIESGDWPQAENRMLLWFNVLNSTEIVKTDRRLAAPHPLDLLSFDSLRRLSAEVEAASPLGKSDSEFTFDGLSLSDSKDDLAILSLDYDLDLDADLVSVDSTGSLQLWVNDGSGAFTMGAQQKLDFVPTGMVAADLFLVDSSNPKRLETDRKPVDLTNPDFGAAARHDTFQSMLVYGPEGVQLVHFDGRSSTEPSLRMTLVEGETGLEDVRGVTGVVAGDLEADGDLDLIFATESDGVRLFVNRGNRSFFEITPSQGGFAADDPVSAMSIVDLDRDLDMDVVMTHAGSGKVAILENLLHLQFRHRYLDGIPEIQGAASIAVEDVDGNVSWDLIVGGASETAIIFSQTAGVNAWTVDRVERSDQASPAAVIADFDNDSWMDVLAIDAGKAVLSRIGPWGFGPWQAVSSLAGSGKLALADFDRDGSVDLGELSDQGIRVMLNRTKPLGHHVDVRFRGVDDNVTGRVNHYAIGSVLELRFGPHYRARVVRSETTHFGIDGLATASSLRAILPNGLTQTIRDPKVDTLLEEEQIAKGSCPFLYTWDGEKYAFQTDCLWAAPLGLQVAWGVVAQDRPWEYLKINGDKVKPHGDRYEFRITEELWEVAYLDKVALTVVDHPDDVEVWTNEKVGPASIATPTIFAFGRKDRRPLVRASDTFGRDVTKKLRQVDQDFVQGFDRRLLQGLCKPHWIDLDFGDAVVSAVTENSDAKVYLVLTGWILPTDTSLNIQIDQNPDLGPLEFPSVWVPDAGQASGWRNAIPSMGFPGGKTKTIVVDVTDEMNRDDVRFRIRTSAQIYWDSAEIAVQHETAEFRSEEVELLKAEVAVHGFSQRFRKDSTHPHSYDYQQATLTPQWPPLLGQLTRLGICTDLVRDWDDRMAVISGGDEIRLEFSLPQTELPEGWRRDFVLHNVGWDKDADLNTLRGQSIGPLPYREMSQYPPPAGAEEKTDELRRLNASHLQRSQSFRAFWYRQAIE